MADSEPIQLGKYECRHRLGSGMIGVVYEGWDPDLGRRVAIKAVKLPDDRAEAERHLADFLHEARAAAGLSHPNIVAVYDSGRTGDLAYVVMELVQGGSLRTIIDRKERLPVEEIVRLMAELLAGLQFIHDRGITHRDIKPANVMLSTDRHVKIADFGIAKIEGTDMTEVGTVKGTPSYMSPEQWLGEPVDRRERHLLGRRPALPPADRRAAVRRRGLGGGDAQGAARDAAAAVEGLDRAGGVRRRRGARAGQASGRPFRLGGGVRGRAASDRHRRVAGRRQAAMTTAPRCKRVPPRRRRRPVVRGAGCRSSRGWWR